MTGIAGVGAHADGFFDRGTLQSPKQAPFG